MRVAAIFMALTAAYCSPPAFAETTGIRVAPILVQMTPEHPLSSFRIHNGRDHETAFQVEVFAWSQDDGRDVLTPTDDMIVAPSTFLASAGGDQIVRGRGFDSQQFDPEVNEMRARHLLNKRLQLHESCAGIDLLLWIAQQHIFRRVHSRIYGTLHAGTPHGAAP